MFKRKYFFCSSYNLNIDVTADAVAEVEAESPGT